ncbi:MAG: hypothetical protein NTW21_16530 [Verrucomicrobia bacterium]|nr:hypothetical protein [Verrucomicrobiota bacterium]
MDAHDSQTCSTAPLERPDPLAVPGIIRVLLSVGVSQVLEQSGEQCFTIIGKASYPATPGRWAIFLAPVPLKTAAAAAGVILGTHRATRIKTTSTAP